MRISSLCANRKKQRKITNFSVFGFNEMLLILCFSLILPYESDYMSQDTFHFRQFSVCHRDCAMKVGTDGVLLGSLARVGGLTALDIGTGSGFIALMLAQRGVDDITAIDIDKGAVHQASENFLASPWPDRLKALEADVVEFCPGRQYSTIVCNPPYYEHSPVAGSPTRQAARVADVLTHERLITVVCRLLAFPGYFSVILPYERAEYFIWLCWQQNLYLKGQVNIRTKSNKPYKRAVLVFSHIQVEPSVRELCLLTEKGARSKAYEALTADFYL